MPPTRDTSTSATPDGPRLSFEHVFEPGDDDAPAYTGLLLHGTGADQRDLVPLGRALAPGKPLVSPLGKVREQGMPRWFKRIQPGVFDEESIRQRAAELADFLPEAAEAYELDPDRFVAIGFSNGANIAASLLLLHPEALRGAVLLRTMTPLIPKTLPDLTDVPVLIVSGERDQLIPGDDAERLAEMLDDAGADVTHTTTEGAGHRVDRTEVPDIRAWLAEHEPVLARERRSRGSSA